MDSRGSIRIYFNVGLPTQTGPVSRIKHQGITLLPTQPCSRGRIQRINTRASPTSKLPFFFPTSASYHHLSSPSTSKTQTPIPRSQIPWQFFRPLCRSLSSSLPCLPLWLQPDTSSSLTRSTSVERATWRTGTTMPPAVGVFVSQTKSLSQLLTNLGNMNGAGGHAQSVQGGPGCTTFYQ